VQNRKINYMQSENMIIRNPVIYISKKTKPLILTITKDFIKLNFIYMRPTWGKHGRWLYTWWKYL